MGIRLNRNLLKKKNIDAETEQKILNVHAILYETKQNPEKYNNVLARVRVLEYSLQDLWGFPQDSSRHTHQFEIKGCSCPWMDNLERAGYGEFIYNQECPIHKELFEGCIK